MASAIESPKGVVRSDKPRDYWLKDAPPLEVGRESFQVWAVQGGGRGMINVDALVETISWADREAKMTGELQLRKPLYRGPGTFPIDDGTAVILKCRERPGASWKELWRMRVYIPFQSIVDGTMSFQMENDIALLQGSVDDWKYVKGRKKPRGWLVHEVIEDVCRRYGVKLGAHPTSKHRIKNLVRTNTSPWDIIIQCMKIERNNSGRRFTIQMESGRLTIRPLKRSARLLVLGAYLIQASHQATRRGDFATALTVRGRTVKVVRRDKKGHRVVQHKKITAKIRSGAAISKYGYVHRIVYDPDADSIGEARTHGLRRISELIKPIREATLTHPGVLGVRRGDAIRLRILDKDRALDQVIFVKEAQWSVGPGEFTMQLQMSFEDPYVNKKVDRLTEDQSEAALRNGRKPKTPAKKKNAPKSTKSDQRATKPKNGTSKTTKRPPSLGGVWTPVNP